MFFGDEAEEGVELFGDWTNAGDDDHNDHNDDDFKLVSNSIKFESWDWGGGVLQ